MQLSFTEVLDYDPGEAGIALGVTLSVGDQTVQVDARLDTGAAHSIFERHFGERTAAADRRRL